MTMVKVVVIMDKGKDVEKVNKDLVNHLTSITILIFSTKGTRSEI